MKLTILAIYYITAMIVTPGQVLARASNNAGQCYTIRDQDLRTKCLAEAHGEPAYCYGISSTDIRAKCIAEVKG